MIGVAEQGEWQGRIEALKAVAVAGDAVTPPGWCGTILELRCAFCGQTGEHWRWRADGDYGDDGDYSGGILYPCRFD
jgi:hypothetical protein